PAACEVAVNLFGLAQNQKFKIQNPGFRIFALLVAPCAFLAFLLCAALCFGNESTMMESDTLEYDGATSTFTAKGHVRIYRELGSLEADEVSYNEQTGDAYPEGNVVYENPDVRIKAKRAEWNLKSDTGTLYEAEIFSKKDNYHITGLEIEKTGPKEYTMKTASFTTCDAPVPAWCFKGSDIDAIVGDRLKARDATFNIDNVPVLYTPYISSSLAKDRKTGFLTPVVGLIKSKGLHLELPFYWAISDTMDATFLADIYTKTAVGEGLEFRFLEPDGSKGNFLLYHLKDKNSNDPLWALRGVYDRDRESPITGYLNVNYVTPVDLYQDYNPYVFSKQRFLDSVDYLNQTTGRFLESTGEVSAKFSSSRLYLDTQYLVDLQAGVNQSTILQKLPEAGYFINPQRIGPLVFSLSANAAEFWREQGVSGQRVDIYPRFSYAFGSDIIIDQALGLRETAYFLNNADETGSSPHRESLDYTIVAHTRLIRNYGSFIHIIEPSLGYTFIPNTESNLPLFDSTELYTKTSTIELALLNRFIDSKGEFLTVKLTQPYDTYLHGNSVLPLPYDTYLQGKSFQPLQLQVAVQRPITFRNETLFDVNTASFEEVNSDITIPTPGKGSLSVGERYNRVENILFFTFAVNYQFSKAVSAEGNFWYDAKGQGFSNIIAKLKYQQQCWGVTTVLTKSENHGVSVSVLFDLLGLGTIKAF
ncbi:MAG TPA: putative LPS assembly protein LptD, partial [Thermodesulfovibrionales bacterium]|nr:putative LPS assembly protein LptD [Thermodesulfovibrionales bacterium]